MNPKIAIGIATRPEREAGAIGVIKSLASQADVIVACLNGYKAVPEAIAHLPNVHAIIPQKDYGAGGKFLVFKECPGAEYILTVDDDIYYPPTYVFALRYAYQLVAGMGGCIGSLWGIIVTPQAEQLPADAGYDDVRAVCKICGFGFPVSNPTRIHIPGTGVMIVAPAFVPLPWQKIIKYKIGTDLAVGEMAKKHNISCWHLSLPLGVIGSRAEAQILPIHQTQKWQDRVRDCILRNRPWEHLC